MSLPHFNRIIISVVALSVAAVSTAPAHAVGEPGQILVAPFTCGTEWSGSTYAGHGVNDWNLDLNRTSLVWPDSDHDLGQPILAQGHGTIVWLEQDGYNNGAGAYVEIDYGDLTVRYIHLVNDSIPAHLAEIGTPVVTGELIGLVGGTGNASHPHLHLEYWDSAAHVDAPRWQLAGTAQVQITINRAIIDPDEVFVSTNCDGPPVDPYPFADVDESSFAYEDIALLADLGLTTGTSPTTYEPMLAVTRRQMAAFLARLWTLLDGGATEVPSPVPHPFDDVDHESFAYDSVALLAHLELTTGTTPTTFDPLLAVTRQQMAAFLARLWTLLDGGATELPSPVPQPFDDVTTASFAHDHIALLAHLEITTGIGLAIYDPDGIVTREQMASFIARLYRLLAPPEPDVDPPEEE